MLDYCTDDRVHLLIFIMESHIRSNAIRKALILVLVAALALGTGYYYGREVGRQRQEQSLAEVFDSVRSVTNLSGDITAISPDGNAFSARVRSVMSVNLPEEYQNKTILLAGNTKILLRKNKTQEVFAEEMKKYQAELGKAGDSVQTLIPPPYAEEEITANDLKVGDTINFSSKSETGRSANVLDNRFVAIEVFVTR